MKKLLALLICIVLCLSFCLVGCNSGDAGTIATEDANKVAGKTPEELYASAVEELKNSTSFEAVTTQEIVMSAQGETTTMHQTAISKQNGYDVYLKTENDMAPQAEMEITYVDGMYYLNQNGQKVKMKISHEEMDELVGQIYGEGSAASQTLLSIPESWFTDIEFEKEGNSYTLTFSVSADKYTELMGNIGIAGATFTSDVEYTVYFDANGKLEKTTATFTFDVYGVNCECVSTSEITLGDVKITAPADAASYKSVG